MSEIEGLKARIAVLERALLVIKAENDRAKREFTNTSNKVIELAIAAAIAGAGKDLDHELIGAISRDIDDAKIDASKVRDEALEEAAMTKPTVTPAPGDVMSEDVLKAISFLRNDAYGCAWIAGLIERLTRALPSGGAQQPEAPIGERINMLRVALSTAEKLAQGPRDHKTMLAIEHGARHALDRDMTRFGVQSPQPKAPLADDRASALVKFLRWHDDWRLRDAADLIEEMARDYSTLSAQHHDTQKSLNAFLRDTPGFIQRAEAAEAELAKADAVCNAIKIDAMGGLYDGDHSQHFIEACARHAARQAAKTTEGNDA